MTDAERLKRESLEVGDVVDLRGTHPYRGYTGTVIDMESTPFGVRPRVKLANGHEVFVMKRHDAVILRKAKD